MVNIVRFLIVHADDTITVGTVDTDYPPKFDTRTGEMLEFTPEGMVKDKAIAYQEDIDKAAANGLISFFAGKLPFKSWRVIQDSEVPRRPDGMPDEYRDAWRDGGSSVHHDMTHAKEIHKDKLRRARQPLLDALDVEYQRADESDDKAKKIQIAAQKQALRDITKHPDISSATTVEELKLVKVDS